MMLLSKDKLEGMITYAHEHHMPAAVHAIGDQTMESVLDCYEKLYLKDPKAFMQTRHGIVHCQITDKAILDRMAQYHVLALVQPIFLHYDLHMVTSRVGEKLAKTSYAFGSLNKLGVHVSGGSDMPVEYCNVFHNMYCAITRKDLSGNADEFYVPKERLSRYEAMCLFTKEGAYASSSENDRGILKEGYDADFIITDSDIFTVSEEELRDMHVSQTVMKGNVTYSFF